MSWLGKLFAKDKKEKPKTAKQADEERRARENALTQGEREKLYDDILALSLIICNNDPVYRQTMLDFLAGDIDTFADKYRELDDALVLVDYTTQTPDGDVSITPEAFGNACIHVLGYYGHVSGNDVNFTLADMLYNFQCAFDRHRIPANLFDKIEGKDDRMIWDSVGQIAEALPGGWQLLNWQTDGDEYNFFVLEQGKVGEALRIAEDIGELANMEIEIIAPKS